ncbi:MAG: hypothetical protein MHM6MM_003052 [Cercozoa sp. M6MM]
MVTASCPGKVLITGGYLVLQHPNSGLVLPLSARFHSSVTDASESATIRVRAPQRYGDSAELVYTFSAENDALRLTQETAGDNSVREDNKFVRFSLLFSLGVLQLLKGNLRGLQIDLRGDDAFYTGEGGKTGLGSSAALCSSLVAALFAQHLPGEYPAGTHLDLQYRDIAHRVAQVAHCAAQGKVGSGFDVAAAFFGAQRYVRLRPCFLMPLLELAGAGTELSLTTLSSLLLETDWEWQVQPFALPDSLTVVLADVFGGSETPSMVRKVLAWRDSGDEAQCKWRHVAHCNAHIDACFDRLRSADSDDTDELSAAFVQWNDAMKDMGDSAQVPVVPSEQLPLLSAVRALDGVVACGVPGAGGYDAIFVLCRTETVDSVRQQLRSLRGESGQQLKVAPLDVHYDAAGVLLQD